MSQLGEAATCLQKGLLLLSFMLIPGDGLDACIATDSSSLQMEAEVMKNAIPQKNTLHTIAKNAQEHLSFDTLEANEGISRRDRRQWLEVCSCRIYLRLPQFSRLLKCTLLDN